MNEPVKTEVVSLESHSYEYNLFNSFICGIESKALQKSKYIMHILLPLLRVLAHLLRTLM